MTGGKFALLVATNRYEEYTQLGRLKAPANDVRKLATVLRNHQIAGFEVKTLCNKPHHQVATAIGEFYADRGRDDLVLLYFSGHGVKDEGGRLHLATTNTRISNLRFTAVQADQVSAAMNECRSGQKVLVLDCCFAGAFPSGFDPKGDQTPVNALEQLGGRGSVVLTSSDAMQYSFEENRVTEVGLARPAQTPTSLFTRIMVEGLRTGAADLDHDGDITVDELYWYVHQRVTTEQPHQHPQIKEDVEGRIRIAQNIGWKLPAHIVNAIDHPNRDIKLTTLKDLRGLHSRGNAMVRQRAVETLRTFAQDESTTVKHAAAQLLSELSGAEGQPPAGEPPAHPLTEQTRPGNRKPGTRRSGQRPPSAAGRLVSEPAEQAQRETGERGQYDAQQKQREVEERARAAGLRAEEEWRESARYALQEVLSSAERAGNRQRRPKVPTEHPGEIYAPKAAIEDPAPGIASPGSAVSDSPAGQASAGTLRGLNRLTLAGIGFLALALLTLVVVLAVK